MLNLLNIQLSATFVKKINKKCYLIIKKICCMKQIQAHLFEFNKHTHRLNGIARLQLRSNLTIEGVSK